PEVRFDMEKTTIVPLDWADLSLSVLKRNIGAFLCGVVDEKEIVTESRMVYQALLCPGCNAPMFPYGGCFVCHDCRNVLDVGDFDFDLKDGVWPAYADNFNTLVKVDGETKLTAPVDEGEFGYRVKVNIVKQLRRLLVEEDNV
ncbi:MAG: hypothetical protein GXO39_04415, partial [Thermotogae bacterium]|nr:hypothetical protein [Thermotogota bacterium]